MAHYMGPTASVSEILEKLSVIFGTIVMSFQRVNAKFLQNISQVNEKVPSFVTQVGGHLEPNLNSMPQKNSQL